MNDRTYGFIVETESRYGTTYVTARIVCREKESPHPINCQSEGESEIWDAPQNLHGFMLDGLALRGFVSESQNKFIGFAPQFYDLFAVDQPKGEAILRTLKRINRQIERENALEAGDVLMAVVRALRLEFFAQRGEHTWAGFGYAEYDWTFWPVEKARDEFRRLINQAKGESIAA
jgi:hypothetical protein